MSFPAALIYPALSVNAHAKDNAHAEEQRSEVSCRDRLKVAVVYKYGTEMAKNGSKAQEFFNKSCRLGNKTGCNSLRR